MKGVGAVAKDVQVQGGFAGVEVAGQGGQDGVLFGGSEQQTEVVGGIAREAHGVVAMGVLEESELAEIGGGGVEFEGDLKVPLGLDGCAGRAYPVERSGGWGVRTQALGGEVHVRGVAVPLWGGLQEGIGQGE